MKVIYTTNIVDGHAYGCVEKPNGNKFIIGSWNNVGMDSISDLIGLAEYLVERGILSKGDVIDYPESGVNWEIQ